MADAAGNRSELERVFQCLSPLLLPAFGFIIAVFLSMFLPNKSLWAFCSKLLMVCFGLIGWAVAACFIQRKKLHCGATNPIESEEWAQCCQRYGFGLLIIFTIFVLAIIGLFGAAYTDGCKPIIGLGVYFLGLIAIFSVLVGEMGWGDPLKFFKMSARIWQE